MSGVAVGLVAEPLARMGKVALFLGRILGQCLPALRSPKLIVTASNTSSPNGNRVASAPTLGTGR